METNPQSQNQKRDDQTSLAELRPEITDTMQKMLCELLHATGKRLGAEPAKIAHIESLLETRHELDKILRVAYRLAKEEGIDVIALQNAIRSRVQPREQSTPDISTAEELDDEAKAIIGKAQKEAQRQYEHHMGELPSELVKDIERCEELQKALDDARL